MAIIDDAADASDPTATERSNGEQAKKLNPMAKEFVPPSLLVNGNAFAMHSGINRIGGKRVDVFSVFLLAFVISACLLDFVLELRFWNWIFLSPKFQRTIGCGQGKRRMNAKTSKAQREEVIRRTVYVSDIDQQVTEEELAALFIDCGQIVDCRVCGDPNSVLRFAFIEFTDEEGAKAALDLSGTMLGFCAVKVLPSKTAIAPVAPKFLPRSEGEREMCSRTIYCTNIDMMVTQADVKLFFESICGEVCRLRLLGDYHHFTRIAFVEFVRAESATAALNCSGSVLGSLPVRISPSKTPVRPRFPRPQVQ